jgi:hypothetical protein
MANVCTKDTEVIKLVFLIAGRSFIPPDGVFENTEKVVRKKL